MSVLSRRKAPDLEDRLAALRAAVDIAHGRLDPADVESARNVLDKASERIGLGSDMTIVALAGATGSGKSSLFNALSGSELSPVGVLRPTTATAHATVWGDGTSAERVLGWLGVPRRHHVEDPSLEGLVLLDLPDHDSTELEHRLEVDRLAQLVDVFVWVVDPQKYADAALHEGYLRPLATHAAVTLIVLNQVDRLNDIERRRCEADVKRLVEADGLEDVRVLSTAATTGHGLEDLRAVISERVERRRAALERIAADLDAVARRLRRYCGEAPASFSKHAQRALEDSLASAAGADVVTDAVRRSHRRDAALAMGWPFTRWLRRLRPDPLARLHLRSGTGGGHTSLPVATPLQRAQAETGVRSVVSDAAAALPAPWPDLVRERAARSTGDLLEDLDRAVSAADVGAMDRPRWWTVMRILQTLLAGAAVVGFSWLTLLFVLQWFQIPRPPTPAVEEIPWPTMLLIGGLLAGFLLALLSGQLARVGAARRRRRADRRLRDEIAGVATKRVLDPVRSELDAYARFCDAVARMRR